MGQIKFHPKGLTPTGKPGIVEQLATLRRSFEKGATHISEMSVPAVLLLSDVCDVLKLNGKQRSKVLGREGVRQVKLWSNIPIRLNGKSASEGERRSKRGS